MSGLGGPEIIKFTILLWKKLYIGHSSSVDDCAHRINLYTKAVWVLKKKKTEVEKYRVSN